MNFQKLAPDSKAPYQKMYVTLFKAITTALCMFDKGEFMLARSILVKAQQDAEDLYIEAGEEH